MEILRSSESQFISCKGSSGASPSYLMDNFNANEAQAATTMADIFVLGSSVEPENQRQQAPKLEDFFGDSPSIVRYSDNSQAETQDSSLTHIYDHGPAAYFNEHQDLKAIIGFQAFSTNSGSEVDDSASIARSHISSNKILVHSIESTRNELVFSNWGVSNHGLSLGVDCSNKIADTFGQRTSIYRGITRHRWTGRYGAHPWDNSCRKEGLVRKERQALPLLWSMSIIAFFFLLLLAPSSSTTTQGGPTKHRSGPTKHRIQEIVAQRGVVATDDGRCSNIATDILREGGHAVDAAVAAALCLGVVSSASSGIGGGAFMVVRTANGVAKAFDMREVAPASASQNMYAGNATLKASGVLSVAVPGELAGLHKAWELYGRLPWQRLVWPAERLARRGFRISPYLHMQMVKTQSGILADKGLRDIFTSSGRLLQPGDKCQNKKLAMTLKKIAKYGIQVFYNGSIGFNMVQDIQKAGGILTMEDLRRYQVKSREPVSSNFQDLKILSMPPPSSGGASMILILNILSLFGVPYGFSGPLGIHREIEALKHAFAVRMNLGDPDFVNVNEVLADMLSPEFAEKLKQTIFDNRTFDVSHYGGRWNQIHDHGTSHVSIIDKERNAVSMTNTVNSYFGAQILSPSTGIVMNNEMDDFSMSMNASGNVLPPAPPNFISPGKRPLSSMTPTIVLKNGQLKAVIGASGGVMIIAGTMEVFLNHFARGMDPLSSVLAPRVYHELIPNILYYENWTTPYKEHIEVSADVRAFLQERGHVIQGLAGGTICQFIVQDLESSQANRSIGELVGVSDPRKGGFPAGF